MKILFIYFISNALKRKKKIAETSDVVYDVRC